MVNLVMIFATSLLIVLFAIPSIITVAKLKGLYDKPNDRKLHTNKIPRLGGLAIFASFTVSICLWGTTDFPHMQYLTAGLIMLFFSGLKDDIIMLSPVNKLVMQICAAALVCIAENIRITSFHGLFGINEIPFYLSVPLSMFTLIVITNAFNLIDGVDGLAGGLSFIVSTTFAFWFHLINQPAWALMAFSLSGAILGFLFFNFNPAKIFMGDAGSLTIGFIISVFTIKFIDLSSTPLAGDFKVETAPALAIAILIVPLYDTLRVVLVRLSKKRSPFKADRNHIHHWLLKLGLTHREVCYTLYFINLLFVSMAFLLKDNSTIVVLLTIVVIAAVVGQLPAYIYRHKITELEADFDESNLLKFEMEEKSVENEYKKN